MRNDGGGLDRIWFWFAAMSFVFLVVLAISPIKDYFREYRKYQIDYRDQLLERAGTSRELRDANREGVRIRQIWNPDYPNRVDRCTSCHLGVENPGMADASPPLRTHPMTPHTPEQFASFGCVTCHRGQGRATTMMDAHGLASDWATPMLPLRYTEASCGTCHMDEEVPEANLLSRGRTLMAELGCYACHEVDGHEAWESDAPDLDGLSRKTSPEWLRTWIADPQSVRPTTKMPYIQLGQSEIDSLVAFLWTRPAGEDDFLQDEENPAGDPDRGETLFRESRCISCHTVDGRGNGSAAELSGIASKVNRRWLIEYLENPHALQPETKMPRYYFTRQDLLDLSQYLMDELWDPEAPPPVEQAFRPPQKMVEGGMRTFRKYGCSGCHQISGLTDRSRIGPELTGIGRKPVDQLDFGRRDDLPRTLHDWIGAKVSSPRSFRDGLKMPQFILEGEDLTAVITALLSNTGEVIPEEYRVERVIANYDPPGRFGELVDRYRCLSCHEVEGVGGDISTAPLTVEGSRVQESWLKNYLLRPSTIRPILTDRMIPLRMPEEDAAFLANFMQNVYVDDDIPARLFSEEPDPANVRRGSHLFYERYGCQACHMIDGRGGYFGPLLDEAGVRLKPGWVYWWVLGSQRWRDDVRCPDYGVPDRDALDLAAFISSLGRTP